MFRYLPTFALSVLSMFFCTQALSTPLLNGGKISEAISVVGEIDTHTFTANAGDSVFLSVADTETTEFVNSAFTPRVDLFAPDGSFVIGGQGGLVGRVFQSLAVSGVYTVTVKDVSSGNDETGSYDLHFAKMPGANEGGTLPNGDLVSGNIELGDIDSFTFSGNAGDGVYLSVADTETTEFINSDFTPRVVLFAPDGSAIVGAQGSLVGSVFHSLTESGTYTAIVRDVSSGLDAVGSYDLHFARIPGANDGGILPNGDFVSGNIDLGDIDTFTFTGNAGDSVFLSVADTETTEFINSDFTPRVVLFAPNGSAIVGAQGALVGRLFHFLTVSGTYSATVRDVSSGLDAVGSYDLYYSLMPGANDGNGISGGQTKFGFIDLGDLDAYAFSANALGTNATFTITDEDSGPLVPRIVLFAPDGSAVTGAQGNTTAQINAVLNQAGNYTLIVRDVSSGEDAIGNYRLQGVGNFTGESTPTATCNGLPVTVDLGAMQSPTSGNDVILGTSNPDVINALGGNDTICGRGGNDIIYAGNGDDWVDAGGGNDDIFAGGGNDMVFGGTGKDDLFGGPGNDSLSGEEQDDVIFGNSGNDIIDGGDGVDRIKGGSGNDDIETGPGATVGSGVIVDGGAGDDTITGGPDADEIRGASENDTINGGGGNDRLFGGGGIDEIFGQAGNDLIRGNAGDDTLNGGNGQDDINGGTGKDLIIGGADADTLSGSTGNDEIRGDSGNDTILGGGGNDMLFGNSGVDAISGGGGDDSLNGGGGAPDNCNGNSGVDTATASCEVTSNVP